MIGMTVCSGIGAPELSAPWIDWRYQSEIEKFPAAVLAHRFPDAINLGDMTKFKEWPDATIDVLCGGTPCQSFSVAGLRKGLDDPRGNLMLTYLAIARRYRPRWMVWENVPGVLSSNGGRDFGSFLWGLGELGYGFAYRVLDAQFVRTCSFPRAVPQRRRRVFVVGYLGDWRRAAAVLFDGESLSGNPPPRREAGQVSAADFGNGFKGSHWDGSSVHPSLNQSHNTGGIGASNQEIFSQRGAGLVPHVSHALRGEGFDASEDGTGRGTPLIPVAMAFAENSRSEVRLQGGDGNVSPQLTTGGGKPGQGQPCIAIQERAVCENPNAGPDGAGFRQDGTAYTLEARTIPQAVCFSSKDYGADAEVDLSPTLRAGGHAESHANAGVPPAVAFDLRGRDGGAMPEGPHDTANLRAASGGSSRSYVAEPWAVRRLTPTECHRLMGFPDDWCQIPWRGKPADQCPDGPQYKALGNSWAVNCGEWIFDRIKMVEGMAHAAE